MGIDEELQAAREDPRQLTLPLDEPLRHILGPILDSDLGLDQRTKFCFVYCGPERCNCQSSRPPFSPFESFHRYGP